MMSRLTIDVRRGCPGLRLALAGAILFGSGLSSAGAQTAPPPSTTPAQSAPATPQAGASTYSTTPPTPATSTTSASAPSIASAPAPLLGATTEPSAPTSLLQYQAAGIRPAPFGSDMFSGANVSATTVGVVDPGYIMKPGDQVALTIWGSVPDANLQVVIDTNGNVSPDVPFQPIQVPRVAGDAVFIDWQNP